MLKRMILAILAMMLLSGGALASETFWTRENDLYYHDFSGCMGAEGMEECSYTDAQAAGKYPCHICMPESDGSTELRAAERGNTIVLRVPDGWMKQLLEKYKSRPEASDLMSGFMDHYIPLEYTGRTAQCMAVRMLHGEKYVQFMEDWSMGNASAVSEMIDAYTLNPVEKIDLDMNCRHMNGAWYQVVHAYENLSDVWEIAVDVNFSDVWTEGKPLFTLFDESESEKAEVSLERMKDAKPVFSGEYDNLTLDVYEAMDTYIAVFHEPDGNTDVLENVGLDLGACETDILMDGYMSGKKAVFCCVLTDAELQALKNGAVPKLARPSLAEDADFMDTPYAAVHTSDWKYGVIDENGNWVIQPVYDLIDHVHPNFQQKYFLCWSRSGKSDEHLTVLDGNTLEEIFSLEGADSFGSGMENPLLLRIYADGDGSNAYYYSMETGEKLFADNDFYDGGSDINGLYEEWADGYPRRIVIANDTAFKGAYLADDRGNPVTGEYDYIIPLIWTDGKGLFLTEQFSGLRGWVGSYIPGKAYDGRYEYGIEDYKCGLMDQDGNTVAGMEYVAVQFVSINEIHMIREDGSSTIITSSDWM